jgi:hypothetical protein
MRPALLPLYAIVGLLSVAVAVLWFESDRGAPTAPPQVQVHEQRSTDGGGGGALDSSTTTADQDRRITELARQLDALATEVEQLKASAGRSPTSVPPPTEAEFLDQHRSSVIQIMDEEQHKRDLSKAVLATRQLANSMLVKFNLPESSRPLLDEFGTEYVRRVEAVIEEFKGYSKDATRTDTVVQGLWEKRWTELNAWADGRLSEIGGGRGSELQSWWASWANQAIGELLPN